MCVWIKKETRKTHEKPNDHKDRRLGRLGRLASYACRVAARDMLRRSLHCGHDCNNVISNIDKGVPHRAIAWY